MSTRKATPRSEIVRQRRTAQPAHQASTPEAKATAATARPMKTNVWQPSAHTTSQPVHHQATLVSRSAVTARTVAHTAASPRRVQYKVADNGVETRMLTMPSLHFNWQWVSGVMALLLVVVALMLTNLTVFQVNSIGVDGLQRLTAEDIAPVIKEHAGSIFTIDRSELVEAISFAFPELIVKRLHTALPSAIKITVTERQPILSWTTGDSTMWVDSDGVVFPPRGDAGAILYVVSDDAMPVTRTTPIASDPLDYLNIALDRAEKKLTPEEALKHMDPTVLKAALDFGTQMPEGSTLVYDKVSGLGWKDSRGWLVYFGSSLGNMAFKQAEYQAIVDRLSALGITPTTISVEYVDAPYYRTE